MSSLCPKCSTPSEEDFGLIQCSCGHSFLAGEQDEEQEPAQVPYLKEVTGQEADLQEATGQDADLQEVAGQEADLQEVTGQEADLQEPLENTQENSQELEASSLEEQQDNLQAEPADSAEQLEPQTPENLEEPLDSTQQEALSELDQQITQLEELSDDTPAEEPGQLDQPLSYDELEKQVQDFAGSDLQHISQAFYELSISGIDSPDIRSVLSKILSSPELGLDVDECMGAIVHGVLVFPQMSSPEAIFLVHKLQALPLEISWQSTHASQEEPPSQEVESDAPDAEDL